MSAHAGAGRSYNQIYTITDVTTVHWGLIKTDQITITLQPHSTSQQSNNNLLMIRPSQDLDPTLNITNTVPVTALHYLIMGLSD